MNAIETVNLCKIYTTRVKGEGLKAGFRGLIKPEYKQIEAVKGINLTVDAGETLAFIGPNGAGKSTLIKMLCGILHPTAGEMKVLGMNPEKDRKKLALKIGTVFGQKSQLWLHLPPTDSFTLLSAMYELTDDQKRKRVGELTELFELGDFLTTPVRKLSLGQRIRCEVAASLLHKPELLFLDEPTIGLDVVVKQAIRALILRENRDNGLTVFLTSHDPSDIEHLCRRAVVIDKGDILLDLGVDQLKSNYLAQKMAEVTFREPGAIPQMEGVKAEPGGMSLRHTLTINTDICPIGEVMERLASLGNVPDVIFGNPPMEEIIRAVFMKGEGI